MSAQTSSSADDDDENIPPTLTVTATFNANDTVTLSSYSLEQSAPASEIKPTLAAAFGCVLSAPKFDHQNPGTYFGSCQLRSSKSGLLREYHIATTPLRNYALQNKLELLSIQLTLPDTEVRETVPAVKVVQTVAVSRASSNPFDFARRRSAKQLRRHMNAIRVFSWSAGAPMPAFIVVRAGYDLASIERRLAMLVTALVLPIILAFWLRRRALASELHDKPSVWFSYIRYQHWLLNASLVAWWASATTANLDGLFRFLCSSTPSIPAWLPTLLSTVVDWVPPVLVWITCMIISRPVQEKLRGLQWTRKELALQAIYSLSTALLPLLFMVNGVLALARGDFRFLVVWLVAAFVVKAIAASRLVKLLGIQPEALTSGELRDAAFNMAHRLGVKLQQIYILPAGKAQMANAFARRGNTIAFTDYLLQRMSRREANYILGHELSHLRLKHLQKLSLAIAACLSVGITVLLVFQYSLPESPFLKYGLLFLITSIGPYFWSRRFEFQADAGAIAATGDPQGAISALFKLSSLNMHPLQWSKWSEKWLTHPSTLRRAQAIAKRANIPLEHLSTIAQSAVHDDPHYPIPPSAISGKKLLSSTKKKSDVRRITLTLLGVRMLVPAAFALAIKFIPMSPSSDRLVYLFGAIATLATHLWLTNTISTRRLYTLIPRLKSKLQTEGLQVDAWKGMPVGLAPAAVPRVYEGYSQWDLGFVFLLPDRLCYWGEESRFVLRRDQVTDIKLGPGTPNLLRSERVYIAWRDTEKSTCGVFSLASATPETVLNLRRRTRDFAAQLLQWHKQSDTAHLLPQPLSSLSSPQFGNVTGTSPLIVWKSSRVLRELYLTALIAAGVAVVAGLPFHIRDFLANATGLASLPHAPGSGWYVVAVAVAIRVIQYLPFWGYKEVPVVQAKVRTAPPPPPTATPQIKREPEAALR